MDAPRDGPLGSAPTSVSNLSGSGNLQVQPFGQSLRNYKPCRTAVDDAADVLTADAINGYVSRLCLHQVLVVSQLHLHRKSSHNVFLYADHTRHYSTPRSHPA